MSARLCTIEGCDHIHFAKGLCRAHYSRYQSDSTNTGPIAEAAVLVDEVFMPCPNGVLLDLAAQVAENDARRIFLLLWQVIGNWHLQGLLEETA